MCWVCPGVFFLFGMLYESCGNTQKNAKTVACPFLGSKKGGSPFRHPKAELEDAELSNFCPDCPLWRGWFARSISQR